ncbi:hypothetical protein BRX37_25300 [Sphingomonas sp. S-NIH.Pt3_0716]|nr:hypothetical protein BRX37_25300 [Sphingomonas sp. S-NIH.Pt3_0716]
MEISTIGRRQFLVSASVAGLVGVIGVPRDNQDERVCCTWPSGYCSCRSSPPPPWRCPRSASSAMHSGWED